jgi:hypothetical protein
MIFALRSCYSILSALHCQIAQVTWSFTVKHSALTIVKSFALVELKKKERTYMTTTCEVCFAQYQNDQLAEHLNTLIHREAALARLNEPLQNQPKPNRVKCDICDKEYSKNNRRAHVNSNFHMEAHKKKFGEYPEVTTVTCSLCGGEYEKSNLTRHVKGAKHTRALEKLKEEEEWLQISQGQQSITLTEFLQKKSWNISDQSLSQLINMFYDQDPRQITRKTYEDIRFIVSRFSSFMREGKGVSYGATKSILEEMGCFDQAIQNLKPNEEFVELDRDPAGFIAFDEFVKICGALAQVQSTMAMDVTSD